MPTTAGLFGFASQVKALLARGEISGDPEPAGWVGFLPVRQRSRAVYDASRNSGAPGRRNPAETISMHSSAPKSARQAIRLDQSQNSPAALQRSPYQSIVIPGRRFVASGRLLHSN